MQGDQAQSVLTTVWLINSNPFCPTAFREREGVNELTDTYARLCIACCSVLTALLEEKCHSRISYHRRVLGHITSALEELKAMDEYFPEDEAGEAAP